MLFSEPPYCTDCVEIAFFAGFRLGQHSSSVNVELSVVFQNQ